MAVSPGSICFPIKPGMQFFAWVLQNHTFVCVTRFLVLTMIEEARERTFSSVQIEWVTDTIIGIRTKVTVIFQGHSL